MRGVIAGNDQCRNIEAQQVFGLGAWRCIAVEQRSRHAGDDQLVTIDILPRKSLGAFTALIDDVRAGRQIKG